MQKGTGANIRTRSFELDDAHSPDSLQSLVTRMENTGWIFSAAEIHTEYSSETVSIKDAATLSEVFGALCEDVDNAGQIIAYGELYGWDASPFERNRYGRSYTEGFQGIYHSLAEMAEEWVTETTDTEIPDYIVVDWEETADNLNGVLETFEYDYMIYAFTAM
jgi:hypothetical protein